jgi:hypothetical protein
LEVKYSIVNFIDNAFNHDSEENDYDKENLLDCRLPDNPGDYDDRLRW